MGKRAAAVVATRWRIVEATIALYGEQGVLATSWRDIAQRADVAVGTVYRHFPTLPDLVRACGERVYAMPDPPTAELFANLESLSERVELLVQKLFYVYERMAQRWEVVRGEAVKVPALAEWTRRWEAGLEALVWEVLRPPPGEGSAVAMVIALTDFFVWKSLTSRGMDSEAAAHLVSETLLAWLRQPLTQEGGGTFRASRLTIDQHLYLSPGRVQKYQGASSELRRETMAKKQYLQVSCTDIGPGCGAVLQVATEAELWELGAAHARIAHGIQGNLPPELAQRVQAAVKRVQVEVAEA